jgi:1-carboxybiuret hydrolase subunit AtzH-like protein
MLEVNISEVVAEVSAAFDQYNRAVDDNDVEVMNEMFWDSPHTVRYGRAENLYGHAEIAAYRTSRKTKIERSYPRTVITTFGRDFAIAWTETCIKGSAALGRQSQTWVRSDRGWRIVAAHVSNMVAG